LSKAVHEKKKEREGREHRVSARLLKIYGCGERGETGGKYPPKSRFTSRWGVMKKERAKGEKGKDNERHVG